MHQSIGTTGAVRPGTPGRRVASLAIRVVLAAAILAVAVTSASAQVVISQVYGGGGNSGATLKNDYIELFNRSASPVSLAGWSLQYASSTGSSWTNKTELPAVTLQPGQYYLIQEAAGTGGTVSLPTPDLTGSINLSGTTGKLALVANTTVLTGTCPTGATIIDFLGWGSANCYEGAAAAPATANTTASIRGSGGCSDTNNNSVDFSTGTPAPHNSSSSLNACSSSTNPSGAGSATPGSVFPGATTLLTVVVTPGAGPTSTGLTVTVDLSAIGGSNAQTLYDDATNGDVTAGDKIYSAAVTVPISAGSGPKALPVAIADAQSRTGTATIALTILGCNPTDEIWQIQGTGPISPKVDQPVTTSGIVTSRRKNGFFIQMADSAASDPLASRGVFVFTSSTPGASITVGASVCVTGKVSEYSADPGPTMTEIGGTPTVTVLGTAAALPEPVEITSAMTTGADVEANLERLEGMRVRIGALTVSGPTQGSLTEASATTTSTGVFYGVVNGVARPSRGPGIDWREAQLGCAVPAADGCHIPVFGGNPQRLRVDSGSTTPVDATAGATVTGLVGTLDWAYQTYTVDVDPGAAITTTGNTAAVSVPQPTSNEVLVASLNFNRFFDTTDDPGISDVALTPAAFERRLSKASLAIRNVLQTPDVLAVVEMENLTTLQKVASRVNSDAVAARAANPDYQAYLFEGNYPGGIDVGFLVKGARVTVVAVTQEGKTTTYIDPSTHAAATLNDRPPVVLQATVDRPGTSEAYAFTVIVNHLRSMNGVTTNDADGNRIRVKRQAQADYLADLVAARQAVNPGERIIVVGDFNAYQFNDGYADMIGTIKGTPAPADQVVVAASTTSNPGMYNLGDWLAPYGQQYSYVFDGNTQAIDHALVSASTLPWVTRFAYGRLNADFPAIWGNDSTRPERLSDHDPSATYLAIGTPKIVGAVPSKSLTGTTMTVKVRVSNPGTANALAATLDSIVFRTLGGTGAVTQTGCTLANGTPCGLSTALGDLAPGTYVDVVLTLNVPTGVLRFSITEAGSYKTPEGTLMKYSLGQSIIK